MGAALLTGLVCAGAEDGPGADEASGADAAEARRVIVELVRGPRGIIIGQRGRAELQGEIGDEESVRLPQPGGAKNRAIPSTRQVARARIHPQVLVKRQFTRVHVTAICWEAHRTSTLSIFEPVESAA